MKQFIQKHVIGVVVALLVVLTVGVGALSSTFTFRHADEIQDLICTFKSHQRASKQIAGADVQQAPTSKCHANQKNQMQLGAFPYYKVNMSSPTTFYNAVINKGFNAGFGMQCVAGFLEFTYNVNGTIPATGTGGASGYAIVSRANVLRGGHLTWTEGHAGLQNGDWGVFDIGQYGHVAMHYNGKWLGQNQTGGDENVGSPFSLVSLPYYPVGYFRYEAWAPKPAPVAPPVTTTQSPASPIINNPNGTAEPYGKG